jgi:DNA-directed RNA polymerase beta subunit
MKRKLSVGDKMAGRTVTRASLRICRKRTCRTSKTVRRWKIVLNPLGVPSRMNVGRFLKPT